MKTKQEAVQLIRSIALREVERHFYSGYTTLFACFIFVNTVEFDEDVEETILFFKRKRTTLKFSCRLHKQLEVHSVYFVKEIS